VLSAVRLLLGRRGRGAFLLPPLCRPACSKVAIDSLKVRACSLWLFLRRDDFVSHPLTMMCLQEGKNGLH
jgi:hypothetical protein